MTPTVESPRCKPGDRASRQLKTAYEADKSSLMGSGMDMRDDDFTKAFCSRISAYDLEPQRVSDHAGCSNWEAR